jgi:hypothetical protein
MSYNFKLQAKVFDRMTELEGKLRVPMLSELLRQHADALERLEQQTVLIEQQRPAVEFVSRFVEAKSSKCISDVAKLLKWKLQIIYQAACSGRHHLQARRLLTVVPDSSGWTEMLNLQPAVWRVFYF